MTIKLYQPMGVLFATLLTAFFLSGCTVTQHVSNDLTELESLYKLFDVDSTIGRINIHIDPALYEGAYSMTASPDIYVTQGLLNKYHRGEITKAQLIFVIGHEIGHQTPLGRSKSNSRDGEDFADFWSLLALEDLRLSGYPIDPLDGISYFLTLKSKGDELHRPPLERYKMLKSKIDDWKRTEHYKPSPQ